MFRNINLALSWGFASCFNILESRTYGKDKGNKNSWRNSRSESPRWRKYENICFIWI